MARNFKVGKVDTDKAATTQRELEKGDRKYWTPSEGRNQVRVMPPPEGHDEYFAKAGFHYGIGPDDRMFPCPRLGNSRKDCYLCEMSDRLQRSSDEDDVADGKELKATKRFLMCVMDIDKPKDGFQVWPAGVKAFREVNYYFSDPEWGDVSDLIDGFDFIIMRKGSGLGTEYSVRVAKKPSNFIDFLEDRLGDQYDDEMFDDLPILEEFLSYPTNAEMEAAYNGTATGTTSKGKKAKDDDEDDDEEEEERPSRRKAAVDDDDEDETEATSNTRAGRSKPTKGDADEEDDEEEDDKKAPPARGRSSGRTSGRLRRGLKS